MKCSFCQSSDLYFYCEFSLLWLFFFVFSLPVILLISFFFYLLTDNFVVFYISILILFYLSVLSTVFLFFISRKNPKLKVICKSCGESWYIK